MSVSLPSDHYKARVDPKQPKQGKLVIVRLCLAGAVVAGHLMEGPFPFEEVLFSNI
jgi:hypothetical protein